MPVKRSRSQAGLSMRARGPKRTMKFMKRRSYRRKSRGIRSTALTRNVHCFSRFTNDVRFTASDTVTSQGISIDFSQLKGAAEFTALFDRYMITTIVFKFRLVNNPDATWAHNSSTTQNQWNVTNWFPKLWYCPDYDDAQGETLQELQERAQTKFKILRPNQEVKIVIKPAVSAQMYRTLTSTGYAPKWNTWIDMGQQDVPHYGLKICLDTSAQDPNDTWPFIVERTTKVYFKCKDVR